MHTLRDAKDTVNNDEELLTSEVFDLTDSNETVLARPNICPYCKGEAIIRFDDTNPYIDVLHKSRFMKACEGEKLTTWHIQELSITRQTELFNQWVRKARFKIQRKGSWTSEF